eukprot:8591527-Pyramimonas_sp.AAC.1
MRAIVEKRKLCRDVVCICFEYADHRLGCPMGRPSRGPNFCKTPRVWSHGNGRGHCADQNAAPYCDQLTEDDCDQATAHTISQFMRILKTFHLFII